jgi:hypothetical protein
MSAFLFVLVIVIVVEVHDEMIVIGRDEATHTEMSSRDHKRARREGIQC